MANRFWVGGTATWDGTAGSKWATTSGGAGGAAIPGTSDVAIFDGGSAGAVVTVAASIGGTNTVNTITFTGTGNFTGTLDFSVNNPTITVSNQFSITGSGTRTVSLGSSTINLTGVNAAVWDATTVTGLTFNCGTSTITWIPASLNGASNFQSGGLTYATVTLGPTAFATSFGLQGTGATYGTLNMSGPLRVSVQTATITNAIAWAGTSSGPLVIYPTSGSSSPTSVTLSSAGGTMAWTAIGAITFVTNSVTASNSFSLGNMTNATIVNPVVGGASFNLRPGIG